MKAVVAAFNQEKALVGAFSVLTNLRMELFQALVEIWYDTWKDVRGKTSSNNLPHSTFSIWYQMQRWGGNCLATLVTSVEGEGRWCDVNKMMFKYFLLSCQAESWCPQRCQVFKLIWVVVGVYNSGWTLLQQLQQQTTADNSTPYQLIRREDRGHPAH